MTAQTLFGTVAIVTGASSGLGQSIARELAERGAAVAVNYHSHREPAEELASQIRSNFGSAIAVQADVSNEEEVETLFSATVEEFGRVDLVVANSGAQADGGIAELSLKDWRKVIDLDLTGQFLTCRQAVRQFRQQAKADRPQKSAGSIVCMSSVHDQIPWSGHINYAAAKGGVLMMMKTLAQEVASERIRVNAVSPGAIKTPINEDVWDNPEKLKELLKLIPYGRIGEVADVANVVAWLLSDEADYITGSTLYVDGGMTLYANFKDNG